MTTTPHQSQAGKTVKRSRICFLIFVSAVLWLARVPYRLREIEERQCEPGAEPKLFEILQECINAVRSGKLGSLNPFSPKQIQARNEESLKAILELSKESVKNGFDRLESIEKKVGVLFAVDGLLISLCAFLIEKDDGRFLAIPLVAFLILSLVPLVEYYHLNRIQKLVLEGDILGDDNVKRLMQLIQDNEEISHKIVVVGNYLADLFRAARRFVCCALVIAAASAIISVCQKPKNDLVEKIRGDQDLIRLLQGPRGEPGKVGPKGEAGTISVIYITNRISNNALTNLVPPN